MYLLFSKNSFFSAALALFLLSITGCREPKVIQTRTVTRERSVQLEVVLPREGTFHTVTRGETLYSICKSYGKSVEAIRLVNGMEPNEILRPGQLVFLPGARPTKSKSTVPPSPARDLKPYLGRRTAKFIRPVEGKIVLKYKQKDKGVPADGITFNARPGRPVWAVRDGTVRLKTDHFPGLGRTLMVEHGGGLYTLYGRLGDIRVRPNQKVRQGQVIGVAGPTGSQRLTRVHLRVYKGKSPVNPMDYF